MIKALKYYLQDMDRYRLRPRSRLTVILLSQGLWACAVYRFLYPWVRSRIKLFRVLGSVFYIVVGKFIEVLTAISLPPQCETGPGLFIGHFGTVIINPRIKIGSNCNLSHGVTIGAGSRALINGKSVDKTPVLGDRVYVRPGAVIVGDIMLGNDVAIGANAVVTKSLPDRAVAVGVPARIISYKGSFLYVNYKGMEADLARLGSLQALGLAAAEPVS